MVQHVENRPDWRCRACGQSWPCPPARTRLRTDLRPATLRVSMWLRLEGAAMDMPGASAAELFERFLWWTGAPLDGYSPEPPAHAGTPPSGG